MKYQHQNAADGRWSKLSIFQQMANIGSEVGRAINWRLKNADYSRMAFERALELLDLTIDDKKNHSRGRLKELFRLRECLADYFYFDNEYGSSDKSWQTYFDAFAYAASIGR